MKKILSIFGVLLITLSFVISSCNTSSRLCPAYPPSVLQGDIQDNENQQMINEFENIEISDEVTL